MPETVQTFADVIAFLYQDSSVPESRRRYELSALRSMARLLGKEPADIPANTAWLRQRLKQFHPRQAGISNKRFANIKSAVVSALRRAGAGRRLEQAKGEMSEINIEFSYRNWVGLPVGEKPSVSIEGGASISTNVGNAVSNKIYDILN